MVLSVNQSNRISGYLLTDIKGEDHICSFCASHKIPTLVRSLLSEVIKMQWHAVGLLYLFSCISNLDSINCFDTVIIRNVDVGGYAINESYRE